jgi:hypothetical protein
MHEMPEVAGDAGLERRDRSSSARVRPRVGLSLPFFQHRQACLALHRHDCGCKEQRPQAELEAAAGWGLVGHAAILADWAAPIVQKGMVVPRLKIGRFGSYKTSADGSGRWLIPTRRQPDLPSPSRR